MRRDVTVAAGERPFALGELFFSTTDGTGRIRSSNEVFERISGYEPPELLGQPHNLIRHPDMPRVVFRTLWDHLDAGKGVAAYVKNRAKDGTCYWVLAAVRPVDGSHLSVRLKPTSPLFAAAQRIYAELRALEGRIEAAGGSRSEAMDASALRLGEMLAAAGFADYDAFMRTALVAEVTARHHALGTDRHALETSGSGIRLSRVGRSVMRLVAHLDDELGSLDGYLALNQQLAVRCGSLVALAHQTTFLALNVELAAGRLGNDGASLRAIAGLMHDTCPQIVQLAQSLVAGIEAARGALERVGFAIALASLQNEMALSFLDEIDRGRDGAGSQASIETLTHCLQIDIAAVLEALDSIRAGLHDVARKSKDLQASVEVLGAIERNARVEASRTERTGQFLTLLGDVRAQVASADDDTDQIGVLVTRFDVSRRTKGRADMVHDLSQLALACEARRAGAAV